MNYERLQRLTAKREEMTRLTLAIGGTKVNPWFPIKIGDQDLKLEYDLDAAIQLFEDTGINIHRDTVDFTNPKVFLSVLMAGLAYYQPTLTDAQIKRQIKQPLMNYYQAAIYKALEMIQPDQTELAKIMGDLEAIRQEERDETPLAMTNTSLISGQPANGHTDLEIELPPE